MDKAIIKSTGEIVEIKVRRYPIIVDIQSIIDGEFNFEYKTSENRYELSNGMSYREDELIVDKAEIESYLRNNKIDNIIK